MKIVIAVPLIVITSLLLASCDAKREHTEDNRRRYTCVAANREAMAQHILICSLIGKMTVDDCRMDAYRIYCEPVEYVRGDALAEPLVAAPLVEREESEGP